MLHDLAKEVGLKSAINDYFSGENINQTENRAVLHTALRAPESATILFEGKNVMPEIFEVKNKKKDSEVIRFIDLFAGIGGFHIALRNIGAKCVFVSEWDSAARKTYTF